MALTEDCKKQYQNLLFPCQHGYNEKKILDTLREKESKARADHCQDYKAYESRLVAKVKPSANENSKNGVKTLPGPVTNL